MAFPLEFSPVPKATLGFVQLPSDCVLEGELPDLLKQLDSVGHRLSKMNFTDNDDDTISAENYEKSKRSAVVAAGSFQPAGPLATPSPEYGSVDVLSLACTSMSMVLGHDAMCELLREGYPGARAYTTMFNAVCNGIKAVARSGGTGRARLALITPYSTALHAQVCGCFEAGPARECFELVLSDHFDVTRDSLVSQLTPESVLQRAKHVVSGTKVDIVLLCCSALRTTGAGYIARAEREISEGNPGVTVLTSTQCLVWESLHLARCADVQSVSGYGRLFQLQHPDAPAPARHEG